MLQPTQKTPLFQRHISEAVSLMFPCLALGRFRLEEVWASGLFAGESYGGQNQSSKVFRTWKYVQFFLKKGTQLLISMTFLCKHAEHLPLYHAYRCATKLATPLDDTLRKQAGGPQ